MKRRSGGESTDCNTQSSVLLWVGFSYRQVDCYLKSLGTKITAVSHFVPERIVTNHDLAKFVDTSDEWIVERTGIRERRFADKGAATSDLATQAALRVLEQRGITANELDLIIVATVTPDMFFPSAACLVQQKIGAGNAWAFDLSGACSGFIYALAVGSQFIATKTHRKVLIIGADVMTSIIDFQDRATCVLFGDGAGAALLEPAEAGEVGIIDFILKSDGSGGQYLYMPGGGSLHPTSEETIKKRMHVVHQDGKNVFKYAVRGMADVSKEMLERHGIDSSQIKLYVPHQANLRIIDAAIEKMALDRSRVAINIDRFANTTAGTIPICLSEAQGSQVLKKGDLVLLASFGAGFTWGSLLIRWEI